MKIAVAYIRGLRGYKGELAAVLYRPSSESLKPGVKVTLQKDDRSGEYEVEEIKLLKNRVGVKLKGIEDEEAASSWRGGEILLEKENLAPLDKSEFYHFEIEGAEVFDTDGELIGTVTFVDSNAGNDILNVRTEKAEIMIPFVKAFVKSIDIESRRIVVEKIEDLF